MAIENDAAFTWGGPGALEEHYARLASTSASREASSAETPLLQLSENVSLAIEALLTIDDQRAAQAMIFGPEPGLRREVPVPLMAVLGLAFSIVQNAREAQTEPALSSASADVARELTAAAVRAVDHSALDRGFAVQDADSARAMLSFALMRVVESIARALVDRETGLSDIELAALDAATAGVVFLSLTHEASTRRNR